MGIDWARMRPKPGVDDKELSRLIALQAEGIQGTPSFWTSDGVDTDVPGLCRQYGESSEALAALLDFPKREPPDDGPNDFADLTTCWRVYAITHNGIFPPRWRLEAHRTMLAEDLRHQIVKWKQWLTEVKDGYHQEYLLDLYLHDTTILLPVLFQDLKNAARESLTKTGKWASRPDLVEVRNRILAFQVPAIYPAPLLRQAGAPQPFIDLAKHEPYQEITGKVKEVIALTRSWDANVRDNRKCRYYEDYYLTFDQFLEQANGHWLHDFLKWAETCCDKRMGLFLDY
jgi:hypothetical protein